MASIDILKVDVQVRLAWWWHLYASGILACVLVTGLEPDWVKVNRVLARAMRVRFGPCGKWHRVL